MASRPLAAEKENPAHEPDAIVERLLRSIYSDHKLLSQQVNNSLLFYLQPQNSKSMTEPWQSLAALVD